MNINIDIPNWVLWALGVPVGVVVLALALLGFTFLAMWIWRG